MFSLPQSWKSLQRTLTSAVTAEMAQRARTVLSRDLPAWLLELNVLAPVELHTVSAELADALSRLIPICANERHSLRGRGASRALALKLSLDRVGGALAPVESALARASLALRRSDPHLAAVGAGAMTPLLAPGSPAGGAASGPLTTRSARECRAVARSLRATLAEAARAATSIERALQGTGTHDREASSPVVAGAIEQTRTLAAWLRQACDNAASQLVARAA